jgi:hypothetical protein
MSEVRLAICDRGGVIAEVARFASSPAFRVSRADADTESGDLLERQSNNAASQSTTGLCASGLKSRMGPHSSVLGTPVVCAWWLASRHGSVY